MRYTISLLLLFLLSFPGYSQELFSVDEALSQGLENNYKIKIAGKNKEIANNNFRRGNAGFLPTVILGARGNYSNQNVTQVFIDGRENSRDGAKSDTWAGDAVLNWTVFDGLRMFRAYERLKQEKEIGDISERLEVENTVADILIAYYRVALEKNAVSALDTSLQLSKRRVELTKTRYELGKVPKLDYLSALVDFNADSTALIRQLEVLQNAKNDLNNILARPIDIEFDTPEEIPLDSTLVLVTILDEAKIANSNLNRLRKDIEVNEMLSKEIFSEKIPQIGLNLGYNYNRLNSEAGFLASNNTSGFNYGVTASWTVFQGTNINRRYQNALIQKEAAELIASQEELNVEKIVRDTYLAYQNNLKLVRLEQQNLEVALENTTIAIDRYQLGKSRFLELRDAQINSVVTYGRLITAIFNTKVAETELLRLSGRILPEYQVVISQ